MNEPFDSSADAAGRAPTSLARRRAVAGGLVLPALALAAWAGVRTFGPVSTTEGAGRAVQASAVAPAPSTLSEPVGDHPPTDAVPAVPAGPTDDERRKTILGVWTREYYGHWTMTIAEDGTGTLVVTPDRLWALAIGPKITVEIAWQVRDGRAVFDTLRGEPESSFNAAMKLWKKNQSRKIVELTDERFVYLSDDGKSNSEWTRARE